MGFTSVRFASGRRHRTRAAKLRAFCRNLWRRAAHGAATPLLLLVLALPVGNGAANRTSNSEAKLFAVPNASRLRQIERHPRRRALRDFYALPNDEDPPARRLSAASRPVPVAAATTGSRTSFWLGVAAAGLVPLAAGLAAVVYLWHRRRQGELPHAVMAIRLINAKAGVEPPPAEQPQDQELPARRAA